MGFWKDWYQFIKENSLKNMKRISISIGGFLILLLSSISYGVDTWLIILYAGAVETGAIIIMSLFGKNGNGSDHNALVPDTENTEGISS